VSLPRYTEMPRTPMRAIPTARLNKSRQAYALARTVVRQRSGGTCEICRFARATETQHRIRRGAGGSSRNPEIHRVSALLHLCRTCHHDADNHTDRYIFGWSVRREHDVDTTTIPALLGAQWWLLDDDGGRRAAPDGGDTDAA